MKTSQKLKLLKWQILSVVSSAKTPRTAQKNLELADMVELYEKLNNAKMRNNNIDTVLNNAIRYQKR